MNNGSPLQNRRRTLYTLAAAVIGVSAALTGPAFAQTSGKPVMIGVSGPLTGPSAQYGEQWKKGFDLALEEINGSGGINGRPLAYDFQDSQNDPRQAIAIAQRFINDPEIVAVLGDFASSTSMAASPLYQRSRIVQFGLTNSHPDFTKTGDYIWSNSMSQAEEQPNLAKFAVKTLGFKRIAILHLNTDWGKTAKDIFAKNAKELGAEVVIAEGYMPDERDFRSTLVRVRDAKPDGIILESYYSDGALIVRQARTLGIETPMAAVGSVYSPKFLELGGDAVNGVKTTAQFFPTEPRPEVQKFVTAFRKKYGIDPDSFNVYGYDSMIMLATAMRQFGTEREQIKEGLAKVKDVPSVIYGKATFNVETRRVGSPMVVPLVVQSGKFELYSPKS